MIAIAISADHHRPYIGRCDQCRVGPFNWAITCALMEHQRDDSITMRFAQSHHACCDFACAHALVSIHRLSGRFPCVFHSLFFAHLYLFLHLGPTDSTCKFFTRPSNKQQQCNTAFCPMTRITLPMRICAACIPLSCLPLLVMLLSETHVALLIKDKQCTEIHPNRPLSHQSICALLTKPTATFGGGRHSPNVQLHITPIVVFIVVVLVHLLHSICSSLKIGCHHAHQLGHLLLSSALSSPLARQGEVCVCGWGGGVGKEAEPPRLQNQMLWGYPPPRRIVYRLTEQDTETHTGELNSPMKELQNAQHHNHIYKNTFSNAHN